MLKQQEKERLIQGTLEWCNTIRAERDMEPLAELPKGVKHDGETCPCGKATGATVGVVTYYFNGTEDCGRLPDIVSRFVSNFDKGLIPELDENAQ